MGTGLFAVGCKALWSSPHLRQEALKPFRGIALWGELGMFLRGVFLLCSFTVSGTSILTCAVISGIVLG